VAAFYCKVFAFKPAMHFSMQVTASSDKQSGLTLGSCYHHARLPVNQAGRARHSLLCYLAVQVSQQYPSLLGHLSCLYFPKKQRPFHHEHRFPLYLKVFHFGLQTAVL